MVWINDCYYCTMKVVLRLVCILMLKSKLLCTICDVRYQGLWLEGFRSWLKALFFFILPP